MRFRFRQAAVLAVACWFSPALAAEPAPVCDSAAVQRIAATTTENLRDLFGSSVPPPFVVLHRSLVQLHAAGGQPADATSEGFYDAERKTINLACDAQGLERIARHETAHHYILQAFGEIPSWLDEGIASYMETAPAVNGGRLREFQYLLRRGRLPRLADLLQDRRRVHLASSAYAAAWGFVYVMLHADRSGIQARRRDTLRTMLAGGDSPVLFGAMVADEGVSFADWERAWIRTLWDMEAPS